MLATTRRLAPFLTLLALLAGCGGGGDAPTEPTPAVRVTVSPTSATVDAGGTTQLSATVQNASNNGVSWTASGGTITANGSSATYTAPGAGGSYTVTATSQADPSKSAQATITVTAVGISVAPATTTLGAGDTVSLAATVSNSVNSDVTWTASAGTVIGTGATVQWAAPVAGGDYTVTATSVLDPTRTAAAAITVTPVAVTVEPGSTTLFRGEPTTLTAAVTGTSDAAVTWSATCGTITGSGASVQYAAPETAGACTVSARSVRDTSMRGDAAVTVRSPWRVAALDDTDDGSCTFAHCSLREAINAANVANDPDSIIILVESAGAVQDRNASRARRGATAVSSLTSATDATITLTSGLPFVVGPVDIVGPGETVLAIDANATPQARRGVLYFTGDFAASLRGLTLTGGVRVGGGGLAIDNGTNLTVRDVIVAGNESIDFLGGGVLALREGRGTFTNVVIDGNRTTGSSGSGGGLVVDVGSMVTMIGGRITNNESTTSFGGGVRVFSGAIMLDGVTIADNVASSTGGGLSIAGDDAVLQLVNVVVEGNAAGAGGGGLSIRRGTTATISGGVVRNNMALLGAGIETGDASVTVTGTDVTGNTATERGGGVFVFGTGQYTHNGGRIANNNGGTNGGGGLYMQQEAAVSLTEVAVDDNRVTGNNGGGIWGTGNVALAMTRGSLSRNTGAGVGGGLFLGVGQPMSLTDVVIEDNTTLGGGAGLYLVSAADVSAGTVRGGSISRNVAGGGGGGVFASDIILTIEDVTLAENRAQQGGGAFLATDGGSYTLTNLIAEDNAAGIGGAFGFSGNMNVLFNGGVLRRNSSEGVGGGIWRAGVGFVALDGTHVLDNVAADQGGGIQLSGPGGGASLRNVTVRGNTATGGSGGGLTSNVVLTIVGSTFADNSANGLGGGVFAASNGNTTIDNSTFSGNSAATGGGVGITGPASLTNVTLVANSATDLGGGIAPTNARALTVVNTLLSANTLNGAPQNCATSGGGTITSSGSNLSDDNSCTAFGQSSDLPDTPAGISATLADNGGATFTHALQAGSAAIDAGATAECETTDQRGYSRVATCDIGAFEFGGQPPAAGRGVAKAATSTTRVTKAKGTGIP